MGCAGGGGGGGTEYDERVGDGDARGVAGDKSLRRCGGTAAAAAEK